MSTSRRSAGFSVRFTRSRARAGRPDAVEERRRRAASWTRPPRLARTTRGGNWVSVTVSSTAATDRADTPTRVRDAVSRAVTMGVGVFAPAGPTARARRVVAGLSVHDAIIAYCTYVVCHRCRPGDARLTNRLRDLAVRARRHVRGAACRGHRHRSRSAGSPSCSAGSSGLSRSCSWARRTTRVTPGPPEPAPALARLLVRRPRAGRRRAALLGRSSTSSPGGARARRARG